MEIIDPHFHLWDLKENTYPWLNVADKTAFHGSYEALCGNYLPEDYRRDCGNWSVQKSVHIQAECSHEDPVAETRWLSGLTGSTPTAVVAYADLCRSDVRDVLDAHCQFEILRGIRQILCHHADSNYSYTPRNYLDDPIWWNNVGLLEEYDLLFDLQVYHHQMQQCAQLAAKYEGVQFVLNHTGMPVESDAVSMAGWRVGMRALASCSNVAVKISGLGMADPSWTIESIRPLVLETIDYFGVERCMFASNFPVDRLFSSFDELYNAFSEISSHLDDGERSMLFFDNAERIYRL